MRTIEVKPLPKRTWGVFIDGELWEGGFADQGDAEEVAADLATYNFQCEGRVERRMGC